MKYIRIAVLVAVFLGLYAAMIVSIVLISTGVLAIPIALGVLTGFFTNVTSDLSPPAMLFAGVACISGGIALALGIALLFPKQPNILRKYVE
jgi:hypothetical protein